MAAGLNPTLNSAAGVSLWALVALYAARIEDLGPGDFVKIDCPACHHVALQRPTPERCVEAYYLSREPVRERRRVEPTPAGVN